jgi:hypothetical protein
LFWGGKLGITKFPKLGVAKDVFASERILIKFEEVELVLLVLLVLEDVEDEGLEEEPPEVSPPPEEGEFELPEEDTGDEIGAKGLFEGEGAGVKMGKLGLDGVGDTGVGVGKGAGVGVSATFILAIALLLLKGLESPLFLRSRSTSAVSPLFPVI